MGDAFVLPTISGTTVLRMTSIFGFAKARSCSSIEAAEFVTAVHQVHFASRSA